MPHPPFCFLNMQLFLSLLLLFFFFLFGFWNVPCRNLEGKLFCEHQVAINVCMWERVGVHTKMYQEGQTGHLSASVSYLGFRNSPTTHWALKGKEQGAEAMQNISICMFKLPVFRIKILSDIDVPSCSLGRQFLPSLKRYRYRYLCVSASPDDHSSGLKKDSAFFLCVF